MARSVVWSTPPAATRLLAEVLAASTDGAPRGRAGGPSKVLAAALARQSPARPLDPVRPGSAPGPVPVGLLEEVDALERAGLVRRTSDGRCELVNQIFASPDLLEVGEAARRSALEQLAALDDISSQQRAEYLFAAGHAAEAMEVALAAAGGPISRADQASALLTAATGLRQQLHAAGELTEDELAPLLVGAARALNDSTRFAEASESADWRSVAPSSSAALRRCSSGCVPRSGSVIDNSRPAWSVTRAG